MLRTLSMSDNLVLLVSLVGTTCLACLFNGVSPQPGTVWFVNRQLFVGNQVFGQVNNDGTLTIRPPPGFNGQVVFTCQSTGGIQYDITVIGEYILNPIY